MKFKRIKSSLKEIKEVEINEQGLKEIKEV
jgi:hypothetical protein